MNPSRKSFKETNFYKLKYVKYEDKKTVVNTDTDIKRMKKLEEKKRRYKLRHNDQTGQTRQQQNLQVYLGNRKVGKYKRSDLKHIKLEFFDTNEYKLKKNYQRGKHADIVHLLENSETKHLIIKKKYLPEHRNIFYNEVINLFKLKDCQFVPKLLKIIPERRVFYMTYCGKPISAERLKNYEKITEDYREQLIKKWGIYHNDIRAGNVCLKGGKVYLIDFGWSSHKKIIPGYSTNINKNGMSNL